MIERLDQVFKHLGQRPRGVRCPAIDGLINEADELVGEVDAMGDRLAPTSPWLVTRDA